MNDPAMGRFNASRTFAGSLPENCRSQSAAPDRQWPLLRLPMHLDAP